jgi:hypothetical protein
MKVEVIDNYLNDEDFEAIKSLIFDKGFPWYYENNIAYDGEKQGNFYYQVHLLYIDNYPNSPYYDKIIPYFDFYKCLYRVKINMYPNQCEFIEHPMHLDYEFKHKAALFSLNDCDGYTKFEDGSKVDSVANRLILFDPTKKHCSTNTMNTDRRVNINFNYF